MTHSLCFTGPWVDFYVLMQQLLSHVTYLGSILLSKTHLSMRSIDYSVKQRALWLSYLAFFMGPSSVTVTDITDAHLCHKSLLKRSCKARCTWPVSQINFWIVTKTLINNELLVISCYCSWDFVQIFMAPRRWLLMTLVIPHFPFAAPFMFPSE